MIAKDARMNERHPVVMSRAHSAVKRAVLRRVDINNEYGLRAIAMPLVLSPRVFKMASTMTRSTRTKTRGVTARYHWVSEYMNMKKITH